MNTQFSAEYISFLEKNKLLPLKETAKMLNMHPATLRGFAKINQIKCVRIGKKYYFNLEDIKNDTSQQQEKLPSGVIFNNGFIKVNVGSEFPSADANGYAPLSRVLMEAFTLKRLKDDERVFYKDKNSLNNKINNLEIKNA